ncbi:uncharacterized protein LOC133525290 [Cydia pomonella]|uniref:uncharacterized protein LOC133525290 n=1 Tax=Cydia pomonella TaxID=82600 RepID=UPI002ADD7D90|nr:uncharacterized protein LOC133525290 [Cydia pomonella]
MFSFTEKRQSFCGICKPAELSSAESHNTTCIDVGDCPSTAIGTDCKEKCGCDKNIPTSFNETTQKCTINVQLLILSLKEKYNTEAAELSPAESKNTTCNDVGDCPSIGTDCKEKCGCDKNIPTSFNKTTQECTINVRLLSLSLKEKYNTEAKIRAEADRIFKGVIVAAFLFIACATVCTLTACIYCCRINYTDYQLKKSIKVLAKKMGKKSQIKKPSKVPTEQVAESCNVVVEDAGIFCV